MGKKRTLEGKRKLSVDREKILFTPSGGQKIGKKEGNLKGGVKKKAQLRTSTQHATAWPTWENGASDTEE